ncbi:LysR family transcriptional regulator (plasmid) [Azospirillum baldaniorum]|uniref:Transcriptional regulator, LysR family n=1 Tax=Azospirillum baldaniorum TaxID=1064539 RepID=A0A9P1NNM0_9PROT|nr:LysR substrate-binding domain-containing protein [Azospirillum baldaniorum]AWJ91630.1 LysR family transcriptional regulator [Azospirillum baldaniorum]TWA83505.1 DNA-binding transcriptional LysR family regulator [Azospirillum brasilense]CCC99963.1 transcriptional regulator, LysR family [Azospirillum baldaniorum]
MHDTNTLRGIDLNLLVVLDALMAERHVSRTASRLNMSQPAVSHALARLRHLFDDPLLIRRDGQLVPSTRALEIAPALTEALRQIREVLGPGGFDPAKEKRTFRLAMSDYGSAVVLPGLLKTLRLEAPGIDVVITQSNREAMLRQVLDGDCDLAVGVFPDRPERIEAEQLFVERFACLADREGLGSQDRLDIGAYLARPHVLVAMKDEANTEIDMALRAVGHTRRIAVTLPHWGNAPRLIQGTDLVLTVARKALALYEQDPAVAVFEPPFPIPPFPFVQVWHERRGGDPAHLWLRNAVAVVSMAV